MESYIFPQSKHQKHPGISLLDFYASIAMHGLLCSSDGKGFESISAKELVEYIGKASYEIAKVMVKESHISREGKIGEEQSVALPQGEGLVNA